VACDSVRVVIGKQGEDAETRDAEDPSERRAGSTVTELLSDVPSGREPKSPVV